MHTTAHLCERYIHSVVDDHCCRCAHGRGDRGAHDRREFSCAQVALPDLDDVDATAYRAFNLLQQKIRRFLPRPAQSFRKAQSVGNEAENRPTPFTRHGGRSAATGRP